MSNFSSDFDLNQSGQESPEVIPAGKYIKKLKSCKKNPHKMISSPLKKKKCKFYNNGTCNKGSFCMNSHSYIPDIAKKICKSFVHDSCRREADCPYSHNLNRYPCKYLNILGHCKRGDQCKYGHTPLEDEKLLQFLQDNQQFLIQTSNQGINLDNKILTQIINHDLLNPSSKKKIQSPRVLEDLPFIFGFPLVRTVSKESAHRPVQKEHGRKFYDKKKNIAITNPFSIRIVYKNRVEIPEKLPLKDHNINDYQMQQNMEQGYSSSKNEFQRVQPGKIEDGIDLTPDSKINRHRNQIEDLACQY